MMIMSTVFALPTKLAARRFTGLNYALRGLAAAFSVLLGIVTVYQIGIANHLLI